MRRVKDTLKRRTRKEKAGMNTVRLQHWLESEQSANRLGRDRQRGRAWVKGAEEGHSQGMRY